ncbi:MAG: hypothetical protein F4213_06475 [Boseongicola sp. SB0677_bin_26]|nr:hypothetical protein [Boseongicola sp. SB0665_bin_10]MYG25655.1 hypothetical protein [Boseongicola sp. SB0677_bin_26]
MKSLVLALPVLLLSAAGAFAGKTEPEGIIRCPDWQGLTATLVPATPADGQDKDRFRLRAGKPAANLPSSESGDPKAPSYDETVRELAFTPYGAGSAANTSPPAAAATRVRPNLQASESKTVREDAGEGSSPHASERPAPRRSRASTPSAEGSTSDDADDKRLIADRERTGSGSVTASGSVRELTTPLLPEWNATSGEFLSDVLKRWGSTAGYTVLIDTSDAWKLGVDIRIRGSFEAAVDELVYGLGHDGSPPRVRLYPNAVLRLGGPL